ncbi:MAG TPA: sigma-70 family RNA polymerase sigma factor [Vicinamibacteria bacterium]|nr:sigma-70 family RNA polymerase sigma factor [Vicinamibacteria bacterium]
MRQGPNGGTSEGAGGFPGTRLSVVHAVRSADPEARRLAWDALVAAYWKPVYTYLRLRWRAAPEDAEDLTQGFFARAMEKAFFDGYDPARARFRTFLRTCLDGYVANERRAASRDKRGGSAVRVDFASAEAELGGVPADDDPDALFQREWLRRVMELALEALRQRCEGTSRATAFAVFLRRDVEAADDLAPPSYADLAREFHLPVTQVTNHLAAMRRELRGEVLRALRALTSSDEEYEAEARVLLGGPSR